MSTKIRFKRGTNDAVKSYTGGEIGEPLFDYQTGRLFTKREDGKNHPVDLKLYEIIQAHVFDANDSRYDSNNHEHFTSLNDAISYLSKNGAPSYEFGGVRGEIIIYDSFEMAEQVLVKDVSLDWITITHEVSGTAYSISSITKGEVIPGHEQAEISDITIKDFDNDATDLNGHWFQIQAVSGDYHYFWFDIDGGSTDPGITGTSHQVTGTASDSPSDIASSLQTVVGGLADFSASLNASTVTITNATYGDVEDINDGGNDFQYIYFTVVQQGRNKAYQPKFQCVGHHFANGDRISIRNHVGGEEEVNYNGFWYINNVTTDYFEIDYQANPFDYTEIMYTDARAGTGDTGESVDMGIVSVRRDAMTTEFEYFYYPAFGVTRGSLPNIATIFEMDTSGSNGYMSYKDGLCATDQGRFNVIPYCGFLNAGGSNIYGTRSSVINANDAVADGAGRHGVWAYSNTQLNARRVFASDCGWAGSTEDRGDGFDSSERPVGCGIFATRSAMINAEGAIVRNSQGDNIVATFGGYINISGHQDKADSKSSINGKPVNALGGGFVVGTGERSNETMPGTGIQVISDTREVRVGPNSTADFATINEALEYLSKYHVHYQQAGIPVDLILEDGFVMEEQVLVNDLDLGWITIRSEAGGEPVSVDSITAGTPIPGYEKSEITSTRVKDYPIGNPDASQEEDRGLEDASVLNGNYVTLNGIDDTGASVPYYFWFAVNAYPKVHHEGMTIRYDTQGTTGNGIDFIIDDDTSTVRSFSVDYLDSTSEVALIVNLPVSEKTDEETGETYNSVDPVTEETIITEIDSIIDFRAVSSDLDNLISVGATDTFDGGGEASDPNLTGTSNKLSVGITDTNTTVAESLRTTIDAISWFNATRDGYEITTTNVNDGAVDNTTYKGDYIISTVTQEGSDPLYRTRINAAGHGFTFNDQGNLVVIISDHNSGVEDYNYNGSWAVAEIQTDYFELSYNDDPDSVYDADRAANGGTAKAAPRLPVPVSRENLIKQWEFFYYPAFGVARGTLPTIGCVFEMDETGSNEYMSYKDGLCATDRGHINLLEGNGFTNAGGTNIYGTRSSVINANRGIADRGGRYGFWAYAGTVLNARLASANDCGWAADASHNNIVGEPDFEAGWYNGQSVGSAVVATRGSVIEASQISAKNSVGDSIVSEYGSVVNVGSHLGEGEFSSQYGQPFGTKGGNISASDKTIADTVSTEKGPLGVKQPSQEEIDSFWPFEDGENDHNRVSEIKNRNDLTGVGQGLPAGANGALEFIRSKNQYVSCGRSSEIDQNNFTVELWFYGFNMISSDYKEGYDSDQLLFTYCEDPLTNPFWRLGTQSSNTGVGMTVRNSNGTPSKAEFTLEKISSNRWYHLASTIDSNNQEIKLYLNGDLVDQVALDLSDGGEIINTNNQLLIGYIFGSGYFDGYIADVRYWNHTRTQQEIQDNMYKQLTGSESGLVAYYPLNDGSGDTATDNAGTNDGTLQGDPTWIQLDSFGNVSGSPRAVSTLPHPLWSRGYKGNALNLHTHGSAKSNYTPKFDGNNPFTMNLLLRVNKYLSHDTLLFGSDEKGMETYGFFYNNTNDTIDFVANGSTYQAISATKPAILDRDPTENWTFSGHTDRVHSVAVSPDGSTVYSGSADNTLKSINASDGSENWTFSGHTGDVFTVAVSPDGSTVYSGSYDNTVKSINASDGSENWTFSGHTDFVISVAVSPDGSTVYSGSLDDTVKSINASDGSENWTFSGHTDFVMSVAVSPDGSTVYSGSYDNTVKSIIFSYSDWKQLTAVNHGDGLADLYVDSVYTGSTDNVTAGFTSKPLAFNMPRYGGDTEVPVGLQDFTVNHAQIFNKALTHGEIRALYENPNDTSGMQEDVKGSLNVNSLKLFDADGNTRELRVYERVDALVGENWTFSGHTGFVYSVAVSPDGSTVYSGSLDDTVKSINASDQTVNWTFSGHTDYVLSVAVSPDGSTVYSASWDNTVKSINASDETVNWTFSGHTDSVRSVAVSPDGSTVYSGSADNTLKSINVSDQTVNWTFSGHTNTVHSVAVSPDGSTVYSGSYDNTVKSIQLARLDNVVKMV